MFPPPHVRAFCGADIAHVHRAAALPLDWESDFACSSDGRSNLATILRARWCGATCVPSYDPNLADPRKNYVIEVEYGHNLEPPTPPNIRNSNRDHDSLEMATSGPIKILSCEV